MRLWIDGQCLQTTSRLRGIGRYLRELIRAIAEYCPEVEMAISFNAAMPDVAIAARQEVQAWIAPRNIHVWEGPAHGGECANGYSEDYRLGEIALAHHIACLAPDIALSASPFEGQYDSAVPLLPGAGYDFPRAAIFYDAIPYRYPARYLIRKTDRRCYDRRMSAHRRFDHLLAISDFARHEAEDILPGVRVAHIDAGVSPDFIALSRQPLDPSVPGRMGLRKPFLLYVGGVDWRKNLARLPQAFALLPPALRAKLQFVLAGDFPPLWFEKFLARWQGAGLKAENLVGLGHVTDENLVQLYKQADLVIQPSLMEGFGLTALEAMFCGAPVIAANTGALPEVVGDAQALFDPEDPAEIAQRIAQFFSQPDLNPDRVAQGIRQASKFSWERTAKLAVAALQEAATKKPGPARRPNLQKLRQIARAQLGEMDPSERTAHILAAAEPRAAATHSRLLIEVGETAVNDHGTGIQRVVKGIAAAMMAAPASDPRPQLCFCDSRQGFFPASIDAAATITRAEKSVAPLMPGAGDHILMLDSSWTLPEFFTPVLRRARLEGADVTSVLYDLTPLKLPAFCAPGMSEAFGAWLQSALIYSTGFVCISRAVADELLALLQAIRFPRTMKIGFWRLGADLPASDTVPPVTTPDPSAPMFLMVSTLEPRKGYRVALDAFTSLWRQGFAGSLYIIGRRGWAVEHLVATIQSHPEYGRKLHWLENASDEVLKTHYAACTALIAAAHAEGFGLPIVEAASHGKPVIASDIPVFREVAGDHADVTYFRMGSSSALASAVQDFVAQRGAVPVSARGEPVTWAQSAAQLKKIVRGGDWYRIYQPQHPGADVSLDAIGDWAPPGPSLSAERQHQLELVEGPIPTQKGLKFVIRVTNLSRSPWSSAGPQGVRLGIKTEKPAKSHFSAIPRVHIPGEAHYMAVELEARDIGKARFAEIGLVQGQKDWWDGSLRVSLD